MAIRLNLFCNGQIAGNQRYLEHFDQIKWGPGSVKRDTLGLPIIEEKNSTPSTEEKANANLQE